MSKKNLVDFFEVKLSQTKNYIATDYEVFKDKNLLDQFRNVIIQKLVDNRIPNNIDINSYINKIIDDVLSGHDLTNLERNYLFDLIENEISGYGPITSLLEDENVTEIMVNSPNEVFVEIDGKLYKDDSTSFINNDHIVRIIQKISQKVGRTIDALNPMVDARLKDGSRLNAIIPPLSVNGPVFTIRKFRKDMNNIEDLIRNGTLTPYMARFLEVCVLSRMNILISGGTGSGKTTLLNVLSNFIKDNERIVTIEDAAELSLKQNHVISLETKNTNFEFDKEVTIRDLVRNSLRMRPDRIIVGEVRGKEAFDMMQAMNTGHDGSITTMHANSPIDALNRLETMILMAGMEIPIKAVREYIENAIDIVVHIERLSDGRRKITDISEVLNIKDDIIVVKKIFAFNKKGILSNNNVDGEFVLYKYVPSVYEKIKSQGFELDFFKF